MKQRVLIPLLLAVAGLCSSGPAAAQQPVSPTQAEVLTRQNAEDTRNQLWRILDTYPRAVGEFLRRAPSLMGRADYMAPYPPLAQFIAKHPGIPRNVEYCFEGYGSWGRRQFDPEYEALGVLLAGMAGALAFGALLAVLTWLVRAVIQHRRWIKA